MILSIRPEDLQMDRGGAGGIPCVVSDSIFLGMNTHCVVTPPGGQAVEIIHESTMDSPLRSGDAVTLRIKIEKLNVFSADGARNLTHAH